MSDISIVESMLCVTVKGPRKTYIYQTDDDLASAISSGFLLSDHHEVTITRVPVFGKVRATSPSDPADPDYIEPF